MKNRESIKLSEIISSLTKINSYEKRKENLPFVYEQLNSFQNYFRICVARLPIKKVKDISHINKDDHFNLLEKLEKEAIKKLYDHQGKTVSFDMIKYRSLLIRLFYEVKTMNIEINKILEYYVQ